MGFSLVNEEAVVVAELLLEAVVRLVELATEEAVVGHSAGADAVTVSITVTVLSPYPWGEAATIMRAAGARRPYLKTKRRDITKMPTKIFRDASTNERVARPQRCESYKN